MESAQREIMAVLLGRLRDEGLIADRTYLKAVDLVHSSVDFPDFFRYNVCSEKEAIALEHTENARGDAKREDDL